MLRMLEDGRRSLPQSLYATRAQGMMSVSDKPADVIEWAELQIDTTNGIIGAPCLLSRELPHSESSLITHHFDALSARGC
jgi:hypothetical protein